MKRLALLFTFALLAGCTSDKVFRSSSSGSSGGAGTGPSTSAGASSSGGTTAGATTGSAGSATGSSGGSGGSAGSTGGACARHAGDSCATTDCCAGLACDPTTHFCEEACTSTATCRALLDACDATHPCCGTSSCRDGTCTTADLPSCKSDGQACATAADCCGNPDAGLRLACLPVGDGGSACHDPGAGEGCGGDVACAPGLDCVTPDGGVPDAGACEFPRGARDGGPVTCSGTSGACQAGDPCDPNVDYCNSGGLVCDPVAHVCGLPGLGAPCNDACAQVPGSPQRVVCAANEFASGKVCQTGCTTDADCPVAIVADRNSGLPDSQLCDKTDPAGPAACQPLVCYSPAINGNPAFGSPADLYKPCANHPGTLCLPSFQFGQPIGMCQAVRTDLTSTVGNVCSDRASAGLPDLLCGKDAYCLGGRCAPICDVQQGGTGAFPGCGPTQRCISSTTVDLSEAYQVGGCGVACDPWTSDPTKDGCPAQFCGGPPAACQWIPGDRIGSRPVGFCRPEVANPLPEGADCLSTPTRCGTGMYCRATSAAGTAAVCVRHCDAKAPAGSPDACTGGKTCQVYNGLTHAGRCL